MNELQRILVVRTDRIGDVILTLPMVEVLRSNFPRAHIAMLVRTYTQELLDDNPFIDEVLVYDNPDGTPLPFPFMAAMLRAKHFDIVFVTYPRFRLALLMWKAGIPLRVGTGYRWYSFLFNKRVYIHRKLAERHETEYNIDLLKTIGCRVDRIPYPQLAISPQNIERARALLMKFGISSNNHLVILHPGSGKSARDWSPAKFGELGKALAAVPDVQVVVTGGKGEEHLVHRVAEIAGNRIPVIVNQLSLREYAALASMASVVVANSTGTLHIAAAVGTPVVGLYPQVTPMNPTRWSPYTDRKTIFVPKGKPANCYACVRNGGECECMNSIAVEDVLKAVHNAIGVEKLHA